MRAVWTAALGAYVVLGLVWWAALRPESGLLGELAVTLAVLGAPLAVAAAILAYRVAAATEGGDFAHRLLDVATAGLGEPRAVWAAAMRAELASIDDRRERRRFAVSCAVATIRTEVRWPVGLLAVALGATSGLLVLLESRASLADGHGFLPAGVGGLTAFVSVVVPFVVSLVASLATRSFRTGLLTGGLCLLVTAVAMLAVLMVEAAHWYDVAGVHLFDGDLVDAGTGRLAVILDPARFYIPSLVTWSPFFVLGAAIGAWAGRRTRGGARHAGAPALEPATE